MHPSTDKSASLALTAPRSDLRIIPSQLSASNNRALLTVYFTPQTVECFKCGGAGRAQCFNFFIFSYAEQSLEIPIFACISFNNDK